MRENKAFLLYLVPYLTFCGALYHITFWDKFNINGLSFLSLSDIIKSSVYPMFSILVIGIYNLTVQNLILPSTTDNTLKQVAKKGISNINLLIFYFAANILALLFFYITKTLKDPTNFIIYGGLNAIAISLFLINNGFLIRQFPSERIRRFVIDLIVFIPVVSYFTGKYKSELIYQNLKYKYSIDTKKIPNSSLEVSSDTLKFLGKTEKHFVFSDLANTKILFIKSDIVDTLTLYEKR